jgi:hypothetical protein
LLSSGVARRSAASILAAWLCFAERSASRCEFQAICALKNDLWSGFQPISLAISRDFASTSGLLHYSDTDRHEDDISSSNHNHHEWHAQPVKMKKKQQQQQQQQQ